MTNIKNELDFDDEYFVDEFIKFRSLISTDNDKNTSITPSDQM